MGVSSSQLANSFSLIVALLLSFLCWILSTTKDKETYFPNCNVFLVLKFRKTLVERWLSCSLCMDFGHYRFPTFNQSSYCVVTTFWKTFIYISHKMVYLVIIFILARRFGSLAIFKDLSNLLLFVMMQLDVFGCLVLSCFFTVFVSSF